MIDAPAPSGAARQQKAPQSNLLGFLFYGGNRRGAVVNGGERSKSSDLAQGWIVEGNRQGFDRPALNEVEGLGRTESACPIDDSPPRSLSDLKEIGCKSAWAVHISPLFWSIE
ncbi:hypothetical protein [Aromatoleum evansii]|uniref:hypothetical protein n=1 Tax=Aromatoleum evansii TaxID=59406 RepID=UPI00145EF0DF|nr:hypothetical protein [Aromatoleum evansii]NMG30529.1 hypothetical protein [Aromatoleum evansii]